MTIAILYTRARLLLAVRIRAGVVHNNNDLQLFSDVDRLEVRSNNNLRQRVCDCRCKSLYVVAVPVHTLTFLASRRYARNIENKLEKTESIVIATGPCMHVPVPIHRPCMHVPIILYS